MKNIKKIRLPFFGIPIMLMAVTLFSASFAPAGETAQEVVKKSDEKLKGKTSYAEMTIQIVRPTWKRDMDIKSWSKGSDFALVYVTGPASEKGNVTLKRGKEVWSWVPSIERTIKLPPSMMMQSWMGTDFTNDDLVKQSSIVTDYNQSFAGDSTIEGRLCYKIILIPKPNAPVVWGKLILFIDKKDYMQLRTEFFDEDGVLVDVMAGSDVKNLGGKTLPSRMEMIPLSKPGQKTVLIYKSLKFDIPIADNFFTQQNMNKVR